MKRLNQFAGWIIAAAGGGWMLWEFFHTASDILATEGFLAIWANGVIIHKIGELLILFGIIVPAINSSVWTPERLRRFVSRTWFLPVIGGGMNLIAWFLLKDIVEWHIWCLILLLMGVLSPLFTKMIVRTAAKQQAKSAE